MRSVDHSKGRWNDSNRRDEVDATYEGADHSESSDGAYSPYDYLN